jgi:hypothetical protein
MAACFVDVVFRSRLSDRGFAMFQRLIDDFKDSTGTALRLTFARGSGGDGVAGHDRLSVRGSFCVRAE